MAQAQVKRRTRPVRLVVAGLVVVLGVAMILNTKFLSPDELAAALPKKFDPAAAATELFDRAKADIPGRAVDLGDFVAAVQQDPKAAAEQYQAASPSAGSYVFAVKTTGTVTQSSPTGLRMSVAGVAEETPVQVPLGTAINGTVLRDALGFKFADAPGQTDYQYVGDELKKLIQAEVTGADPGTLDGKKVDVVGLVSVLAPSGGPVPKAKPVNIQPLTLVAAA